MTLASKLELINEQTNARAFEPDVAPKQSPLPEWAKLLGDVTTTGEVAAKAIAVDVERGAREIESLGIELLNVAKAHDEMMQNVRTALDDIRVTAAEYRKHGAELLALIQASSQKINAIAAHNLKLKAALTDMDTKAESGK